MERWQPSVTKRAMAVESDIVFATLWFVIRFTESFVSSIKTVFYFYLLLACAEGVCQDLFKKAWLSLIERPARIRL
jgi:hypothetical protein